MRGSSGSTRRRICAIAGIALGALLLTVVAGCAVKKGEGDLVAGKTAFVEKCGACHVLNRAGTKGVQGPNLDEAFQQAVRDGFKRDTFQGIVERQIAYPSRTGQMPADLVKGEAAHDVAAYVAQVAAAGGKDSGALATVGQAAQKALAKATGGQLVIPADPNGQLLYTFKNAEAPAGALTVRSPNRAATPHNIAVQGGGINEIGEVVQGGGTSEVEATVKKGAYTFLCTVPGHAEAGMRGKLTVK